MGFEISPHSSEFIPVDQRLDTFGKHSLHWEGLATVLQEHGLPVVFGQTENISMVALAISPNARNDLDQPQSARVEQIVRSVLRTEEWKAVNAIMKNDRKNLRVPEGLPVSSVEYLQAIDATRRSALAIKKYVAARDRHHVTSFRASEEAANYERQVLIQTTQTKRHEEELRRYLRVLVLREVKRYDRI